MARDIHNEISVAKSITPIVGNNDTEGTGLAVDRLGFDSVEHVVYIGISADVLSGTVKMDLRIQAGTLADSSDMADVNDADELLGVTADLTTGIFATVDDPAEDDAVFKIGYRGIKRFTRVLVDFTGTHTNGTPIAAVAMLGHAHQSPV